MQLACLWTPSRYLSEMCIRDSTNSPVANYKGEIYNLPFNMNTFNKLWGVVTPNEAKDKIQKQVEAYRTSNPKNLEEQALNLVGKDIYEKLIKGYTEKQWGHRATELPVEIIKRIPVRYTYDNNYFNDLYQGIPVGGYTAIIEKMLEKADVRLHIDYLSQKEELDKLTHKIVYTCLLYTSIKVTYPYDLQVAETLLGGEKKC